jgi:hypothetical protein
MRISGRMSSADVINEAQRLGRKGAGAWWWRTRPLWVDRKGMEEPVTALPGKGRTQTSERVA